MYAIILTNCAVEEIVALMAALKKQSPSADLFCEHDLPEETIHQSCSPLVDCDGFDVESSAREWLANLRKAAHKSQQAVADEAGISQSYYASIEIGSRGKPLAVPIAKAIAGVLGFDWTRFYDEPDGQQTSA